VPLAWPVLVPATTEALAEPFAYRFKNLSFEKHRYGQSMSNKRRFSNRRVAALLGLAFDAKDGHKRITRGKNFLLAGGSEETHGLMRETILWVNEQLDERGLDLADVSAEQLRDLLDDAQS
jgi:hypothetical protein